MHLVYDGKYSHPHTAPQPIRSIGHVIYITCVFSSGSLQWRHNGFDGVSNHQPRHCLLNRLIGRRSKKTSKLNVTGLCAGNSPVTGEFPAQMASNAENISIWWRHQVIGPISFKYLYSIIFLHLIGPQWTQYTFMAQGMRLFSWSKLIPIHFV